jgi:hypothetical protein
MRFSIAEQFSEQLESVAWWFISYFYLPNRSFFIAKKRKSRFLDAEYNINIIF